MPELLGFLTLGLVALGVALFKWQRLIATGLLCAAALFAFTAWIDPGVVSLELSDVVLAALCGGVMGWALRRVLSGGLSGAPDSGSGI